MIKYPISFLANADSHSGIQSPWTAHSQNREIPCAIPVEFDGPGGALSPEDLFAQALANCFLATFKVYAEKSKVVYGRVSARAELIVDLDEFKRPVMKKFILHAEIAGAQQPERVRVLANRAFASGFILNSVKTELLFELRVYLNRRRTCTKAKGRLATGPSPLERDSSRGLI